MEGPSEIIFFVWVTDLQKRGRERWVIGWLWRFDSFFTSALRQFRIASSHIRKFMTNQGFQIRTLRGFRAYFLFPIKISNGGFAICYSHSAKLLPCISLVAFLFLFLRNKAPPPQRQVRLTAAAIGHTAGFQSFSPAIKNRPCFCHL